MKIPASGRMGGGAGTAIVDTECQPSSCRSPTAKLVSIDRPVSGLSSGLLRALPASPSHACAQWVPDLADRAMRFHSTTVAGAAPESDRLPVLPEPALAGSPLEGRKVGNAGGHVKDAAVLCRFVTLERLHAAFRVSRDRARGCPCRRRRRASLLSAQPQDHDQGRQVAGDRGRRRDREGDPRAHCLALSGPWFSWRGNGHLRARRRLRLVRRPDRRHQGLRARIPDVLDPDRADAQGQADRRRVVGARVWRTRLWRDRRRRLAERPAAAREQHRHDRRCRVVHRQPQDAGDGPALAGVRPPGRPLEPHPRLRRLPALSPAGRRVASTPSSSPTSTSSTSVLAR